MKVGGAEYYLCFQSPPWMERGRGRGREREGRGGDGNIFYRGSETEGNEATNGSKDMREREREGRMVAISMKNRKLSRRYKQINQRKPTNVFKWSSELYNLILIIYLYIFKSTCSLLHPH